MYIYIYRGIFIFIHVQGASSAQLASSAQWVRRPGWLAPPGPNIRAPIIQGHHKLPKDLNQPLKAPRIYRNSQILEIYRACGGCTVVLKPSPLASLTCCALGELVAAAGAPPGRPTLRSVCQGLKDYINIAYSMYIRILQTVVSGVPLSWA